MNPFVKVRQTLDRVPEIHKAVKALTDKAVFIGVPAEKAESRGPINNAELSYIHEFGTATGIPPRPHLRPGIERIQEEAAKEFETAANKAFEGDISAVDAAFERVGLAGEKSVRQMFVDNEWPPLSDKTLNYKPILKDKNGNPLLEKKMKPDDPDVVKRGPSRAEMGKTNPLIITAELQKSHTYVVRKRGGNGA